MKKAQSVTLFIILGILLLLGFVVVINMQGEEQARTFDRQAAPTLQQVPTEARPVFEFITDCLAQVTKDGFVKLGDQGGYHDTTNFKTVPNKPTESEALQFHFSSDLKIPYWYEMQKPDNCEKTGGCKFLSRRPNLYKGSGGITIEEQMDTYVKEMLPVCLREFDDFEERAIRVSVDDDPVPDVRVGKQGVSVALNMPVTVRTPSATHRFENYFHEFNDFAFFDIYELASVISELQANYSYLEKATMNLITLYSGIDAALPPVGASEFNLGPGEIWIKNEIKSNIRNNVIAPYVPLMQVLGTANYRPITVGDDSQLSKSKEVIYNRNMVIPPSLEKSYNHLTANLNYYPIWEPYLDLNCDGQICSAQTGGSDFIIPIGIQRYQFAYDLSYPVLVTITQPGAFNGRGYQFSMALEANIRNNDPASNGYNFIIEPRTEDVLPTNPFTAVDQRTSGVVTINVFEGKTKLGGIPIPAKEVAISFACGAEQAQIGVAEEGTFVARLPRCLNGVVKANIVEGSSGIANINTLSDKDQEVNITIERAREMNTTFKKIKMRRRVVEEEGGTRFIWSADPESPRFELKDTEEATVVMRKKPSYVGEEPFTVVSTIYGNENTKLDHCTGLPKEDVSTNIEFLPGEYESTILVMNYETFEIPETTREEGGQMIYEMEDPDYQRLAFAYLTGGLSEIGTMFADTSYDVPGVEFNCTSPLVVSSYDVNLTVLPEWLDKNNVVEFSGYSFELTDVQSPEAVVEELEGIESTRVYASLYPEQILPIYYNKKGR